MRNFIIGLSILFFALSGLITFKALRISVKSNSYNNDSIFIESKDLPHNVKNISEKIFQKKISKSRQRIGL
jgi:hypothetical protein